MSSKSNKRESLLTQLENMHKKLNEESEGSSETQPNPSDFTQGSKVKKPNLFSNVLNKREKTNSMPTFSGSTAHNGVLTANDGKDMSFVMGLSENLLVECRRLQAENEKKNNVLNQLQKEYDHLEEKHEKMDSHQQITTKEVEALRDTNWELEVKLQQYSVEFKELKDKFSKNKKELKIEQEHSNMTKAELEVVMLEKSGLQKELTQREKEYSSELAELRKNISELNDENDSLYAKIKHLNENSIKNETLEKELSKSNRLVDNLTKQKNELEIKLEKSGDNRLLEAQLSESETIAKELKTQLEGVQKSEKNYGALDKELLRSHELTNELSQHIVTLEAKMRSHINENCSLKSNLEEMKKESKQLGNQVNGLQKLSHELDSTNKENVDLQSGLHKSQQLIDELKQQLDTFKRKRRFESREKKVKNKGRSRVVSMNTDKASDVESDVSDTMENPFNSQSFEDEMAAANDEIELSLEEVEKYARYYKKRLVPHVEYSDAQSRKKVDSEEQLMNTVGRTNLLALPNDFSSQKKSVEESMSIETMVKKVEASGYKVLSFPEFNEKLKQIKELENPSESYLKSKASNNNQVLVSQEFYDKVLHPSTSQLKESLEKLGFTVVDNSEYQKLLDFIENPKIDFLTSKLAAMNKVIMSSEEFGKYTSPDIGFIKTHAKRKGYIAITEVKYDDMQKKISEPPVEAILNSLEKINFREVLSQFGMKHQLVLLNKKEHDQMISSLANPSRQYLIEKCATQHIQPIPIDEYRDMLQTLRNPKLNFMDEKAASMKKKLIPLKTYDKLQKTMSNPTVEFLRQHAKENRLVLLPEDEHNTMQKTMSNPTVEFLRQHAKENRLVLLPEDEHNTMQKTLNSPSVEYLKSKAKNHKLIDLEIYDRLNETFNSPSLEFLTKKASVKGYEIITSKKHQDLLRRAMHPTEDELSLLARNFGAIVLEAGEYEHLKVLANSPPREFILEEANKLNMVLVDVDEYERLKNTTNNKDSLLSSVKGFGFIPVPIPELNALQNSTLEKSDLKNIERRLKNLGHIAMSFKHFEELSKPLVDRATKEDTLLLCSKYSFKPISMEEYQKLKNDSQPTVYAEDELIGMLKSHGYAVIPVSEHENITKTIKSPTVEFLEEHAAKQNMVLIDNDTHQKYVSVINNPTLEYLNEKASILNHKIVSEKEYGNLKTQVDLPSVDFLKKKSALYNFALISHEKYDKLMNDAKNPSLSTLQTKAAAMRKHIIDNIEYGELQRKTTFPTKEELVSSAAALNMIVVVKGEYDDLLKRLEHPTLEYLERSLSQLQYMAIRNDDYHTLDKSFKDPSNVFLSEKAASRGMVLMKKGDYESQVNALENPRIEYLTEKAASKSLLLINKSDHENNIHSIEKPSLEYLREKSSFKGMLLLSNHEYKNKTDALENPSLQYLEEKAKYYSRILVLESEIRTPEQKKLVEGIEKGNLVIITKEELKELKNNAQNPPLDFMISMLEKSNYVVIERPQLNEMKRQIDSPRLEELSKHVKKQGHVLVRSKDLSEKTDISVEDLDPLMKKQEFLLLKMEEYDNLLNSNVDKLPQRELIQLCEKMGFIPVPHAKYEELHSPPTKSKVQGYASKLGLALIPREEFDSMMSKLKKPLEECVRDFSKENNLLLIEKDGYENLLAKIETPALDELKKNAQKHDLVLVPNKKYESMTKQDKHKPIITSSVSNKKENSDFPILNDPDYDSRKKELTSKEYSGPLDASFTSAFNESDIYNIAETMGFKILPTEEYNSLLHKNFDINTLTLSDIQEYSASHRMRLVPLAEKSYEGSLSQLKLTADDASKETVPLNRNSTSTIGSNFTDYFDATDDRNIHLGNASEQMYNRGIPFISKDFTSIKSEEPEMSDSLLRTPIAPFTAKYESPDIEALREQAASEGYTLVRTEPQLTHTKDVADTTAATQVGNSENWYDADNFDDGPGTELDLLVKKAGMLGFMLVPRSNQYDQEALSRETLTHQAALQGFVVFEKNTIETLELKAEESRERLEQLAEKLGYHVLSNYQYDLLKEQLRDSELSFRTIQRKAEESGYYLLNEMQFEELKDAAIAGKRELTEGELKAKAAQFDMVAVSTVDYEKLVSRRQIEPSELSENAIKKVASDIGLIAIPNEFYHRLLSARDSPELSERDLEKNASQLGFKLLSNRDYEELKARGRSPAMTEDMVTSIANDYGLVVLSKSTYESLVSHNSLESSAESINNNARKFGLIVLNRNQYDDLLKRDKIQSMTVQDLAKKSDNLGMVLVPKEQMQKKSDLNKDEVLKASGKLGLVTLDKKEFARLQRLAKPESLKERALAANMICLPKSALITSTDRTNTDDVVVIPSTYYKRLLSREASMISARKQQTEMSKPSMRPPQKVTRQDSFRSTQSNRPSQKIKEQRSINSLKGSTRSTLGTGAGANATVIPSPLSSSFKGTSRELSVPRANSMGAISLNTLESLNEPSIIPALTQTVIGEYLYKYYQVFGVGGESRHERYFWVHPYTMTLYWSPTNPVMENPSNHGTKCASIAKVDSVIDKNASHGLYHKCLVITTDTRVIRIACPTRQRHNVWYNSLRYLLQRSMEGINMEDIAENPSDTMYSGKIFPLSKQPSKKGVSRTKSMSILKNNQR